LLTANAELQLSHRTEFRRDIRLQRAIDIIDLTLQASCEVPGGHCARVQLNQCLRVIHDIVQLTPKTCRLTLWIATYPKLHSVLNIEGRLEALSSPFLVEGPATLDRLTGHSNCNLRISTSLTRGRILCAIEFHPSISLLTLSDALFTSPGVLAMCIMLFIVGTDCEGSMLRRRG
jgi:hypothetical protein